MGLLIFIVICVVWYGYSVNKEEEEEAENICATYQKANKCDRETAIAKIKVDAMNSFNKHLHKAAYRLK